MTKCSTGHGEDPSRNSVPRPRGTSLPSALQGTVSTTQNISKPKWGSQHCFRKAQRGHSRDSITKPRGNYSQGIRRTQGMTDQRLQAKRDPVAKCHHTGHIMDPRSNTAPRPRGNLTTKCRSTRAQHGPKQRLQDSKQPQQLRAPHHPLPPPYLPRAVPHGKLPAPAARCWCSDCGHAGAVPHGQQHVGTAPACSAGAAHWLPPLSSPGYPALVPAVLARGARGESGSQPRRAAR